MSDFIEHVIQAGNPIVGNSHFFTLRLPPAWRLVSGAGRPEVDASHERRNVKWVANGSFWYVLYDGERHWAMEFVTRVRPIGNRSTEQAAEYLAVGGHSAVVRRSIRRRGLPWQRHSVTYVNVEYECPQSDRRIGLELSGRCPEEGFREVLAALRWLRCH